MEKERNKEGECLTQESTARTVPDKETAEGKGGQVWGSNHAANQVETRGTPHVTAG